MSGGEERNNSTMEGIMPMTVSNQFSELRLANVPARDSGLPSGIVVFASNEGAGASNSRIQVSNTSWQVDL